MNRTGTARWYGGIKDGKGTLTTESNTLSNTPYSFSARFKDGSGTNPEEFDTTATLTMEKTDKGFSITKIHLDVKAKIPGGDVYEFQTAVARAKEGCPVSKLLNADITVDAQLVS